jgi:hypothetical protein
MDEPSWFVLAGVFSRQRGRGRNESCRIERQRDGQEDDGPQDRLADGGRSVLSVRLFPFSIPGSLAVRRYGRLKPGLTVPPVTQKQGLAGRSHPGRCCQWALEDLNLEPQILNPSSGRLGRDAGGICRSRPLTRR